VGLLDGEHERHHGLVDHSRLERLDVDDEQLPGRLLPDEDNVLAQKLLLEHDEETFLGIANRWKLADHPLADAELAVPRQVGTGTRVAA
jgi:hypothetical protein